MHILVFTFDGKEVITVAYNRVLANGIGGNKAERRPRAGKEWLAEKASPSLRVAPRRRFPPQKYTSLPSMGLGFTAAPHNLDKSRERASALGIEIGFKGRK